MKKITLILSMLCLFMLTACNKPKENTKPLAIATTGMIHDIVKNIGGIHIQTEALMGPGIDPHLYKASHGDVKKLNEANIIFYNGLHLEAKMLDIFKKMNRKKITVAICENLPEDALLSPDNFEGFYDPHVWFDVSLWIKASQEVTKGLIKLDPNNKKNYLENEQIYISKLSQLNQWTIQNLNKIPKKKRILITAHDAFGYFGKAYQFRVEGLQGMSTASEAGTKDIQRIRDIIIKHQIPTIFIETSVPIRHIKALQAAVKAKGFEVKIGEELFTDAMGTPNTIEGTYIGMIKHNINSIIQGLK